MLSIGKMLYEVTQKQENQQQQKGAALYKSRNPLSLAGIEGT